MRSHSLHVCRMAHKNFPENETADRHVLSASAGGISRAYFTCFLAEASGYLKKKTWQP